MLRILEMSSIPLNKLIENKLVEKMIMVLKAFYTFQLECKSRQSLITLLEKRYNECKAHILSDKLL